MFTPGDEVLVTSYDLGMNTAGGFGQYINVPASWIVKLPTGLTLKESMIYGTAGFTAAQSLYKVTTCGLAQSIELYTNVFPFILRGINLLGINSEHRPMKLRKKIWNKIASEWRVQGLDNICNECSLEEINNKIDMILKGRVTGRIVINLDL